MFFRILWKDLQRKKTMNAILLLFIIMATMFLASSTNNLIAVSNAVDDYMTLANTPDCFSLVFNQGQEADMIKFLNEDETITEYESSHGLVIAKDNLSIMRNNCDEAESYDATGTLAFFNLPNKFMKVFDENGNEIELLQGEIALPLAEAESNHLVVGDKITISLKDTKITFTISSIVRDAVFGSEMMGFKRIFLNENDYMKLMQTKSNGEVILYSINSTDSVHFLKQWEKQNFSTITNIQRELVKQTYLMDMLVAGILIIISVCLILISFLILRFTIVFTLQEEFKEIGIMKALGLKNKGIKRLYLIKYISISYVGALIGCILSYPFGKILLNQVMKNIVVSDIKQHEMINIISSAFVVLIIVLFCSLSANRLRKISVVTAIRNGSSGETYRNHHLLKLTNSPMPKTSLFLALNDVACELRRYFVLILTFCLGTIMITLMLMTAASLSSNTTIDLFGLAKSDYYIKPNNIETYVTMNSQDSIINKMKEMEEEFSAYGIESKIWCELYFTLPITNKETQERVTVMALQTCNANDLEYTLLRGSVPVLENEILLTDITSKSLGVDIGDTVVVSFNRQSSEFIVSGIFQSLNNMGQGARLNTLVSTEQLNIVGMNTWQLTFLNDIKKAEGYRIIKENFKDYEILTKRDFLTEFMGNIIEQLDVIKYLVFIIVLVIYVLITILMMKTFITKETGEIAMLKSIGFRNSSIRIWQMARITIVLVVSIGLGITLARLLGPVTIGQVFAIMGANHMSLSVNPVETYIIYPLIMLAATTMAAYISTASVHNIDCKKINTIE